MHKNYSIQILDQKGHWFALTHRVYIKGNDMQELSLCTYSHEMMFETWR